MLKNPGLPRSVSMQKVVTVHSDIYSPRWTSQNITREHSRGAITSLSSSAVAQAPCVNRGCAEACDESTGCSPKSHSDETVFNTYTHPHNRDEKCCNKRKRCSEGGARRPNPFIVLSFYNSFQFHDCIFTMPEHVIIILFSLNDIWF